MDYRGQRPTAAPDVGGPEVFSGSLSELVERARRLVVPGQRRLLGITGAPASGKGYVAERLCQALTPDAVLIPMDGFHLAQVELDRLGRHDRKGAPDTFDAAGYVALLRRLRDPADAVVYAPDFRREIEEPIAGAIPVPADLPLVITEGNYLLLDSGPWADVRPLLDEAWFLAPDEQTRLGRLVMRHHLHGKSLDEARAWALGSDQRNTRVVDVTRVRADLVVVGDPG